jgi:hypothetical protein
MGAVPVGADLVQAAADEGPADAPDGERDFADGDDVTGRQFPGGSAALPGLVTPVAVPPGRARG